MRKNVTIALLQKITATGALAVLDIGQYTRFGEFTLLCKSDAGTSPTLDVKLQHSNPASNGAAFTTAGASDNILKAGASTTVKLGAKFTQSGARSISGGSVVLNKIGTITAGKLVTVELFADSSGSPTGSALGSTTIDIDSLITTSYDRVPFSFATPVELADATVYHLVLTADYTASASNAVQWRNATVASGGNFETHNDTTWAAVTGTKSFEFILEQYTFTDVTSGAFTQVTTTGVLSKVNIALDNPTLKRVIRPHITIGGTDTPAFYMALSLNAESRLS